MKVEVKDRVEKREKVVVEEVVVGKEVILTLDEKAAGCLLTILGKQVCGTNPSHPLYDLYAAIRMSGIKPVGKFKLIDPKHRDAFAVVDW